MLSRADVPQTLLRARLSLRAAKVCVTHQGRPERASELRDAMAFLQPGDSLGSVGEICLPWQQAGKRPISVKVLHRALSDLERELIAAWLDAGQGALQAVNSGGPEAVLAYLSRYTHRVAISNHRLVSADANTVAFRWRDYRIKRGDRQKVMRLETGEFIRRFLMHVLPDRFHRIRHYGLLASGVRKANLAKIRVLLCAQPPDQADVEDAEPDVTSLTLREPCPCCGGPMRIIEIFRRGQKPRSRAPPREQAA